jgi:hypothetical protein
MSEFVKQGDTVRFLFPTRDPSTGASVDAASLPACTIYKDGTSIGTAGSTVTNKSTGLYEVAIACTSGNGYTVGSDFSVAISCTVNPASGSPTFGINCIANFRITATDIDDVATASAVASVSSSLSTVSAQVNAVQLDTDNIQTRLPAALVSGRMDSSVGAVAANAITAASIATDAIDADAMAASALAEIAAAVWSQVIESTFTAADMFRGTASVLFGKVTDFTAGVLVFRNLLDTKNRITVTTGATGRTGSTVNDLT